jgi:hypothetical protein
MAKKILVKNGVRREFEERAAKIAINLLGWIEIPEPDKPFEVGKRTLPPEITKPIRLIEPPVIKADDYPKPGKIENIEVKPEEEVKEAEPVKVKRTRRKRNV